MPDDGRIIFRPAQKLHAVLLVVASIQFVCIPIFLNAGLFGALAWDICLMLLCLPLALWDPHYELTHNTLRIKTSVFLWVHVKEIDITWEEPTPIHPFWWFIMLLLSLLAGGAGLVMPRDQTGAKLQPCIRMTYQEPIQASPRVIRIPKLPKFSLHDTAALLIAFRDGAACPDIA